MENQQFIAFLKEATYQDHIMVNKENRTTTILDTTNNVVFSITTFTTDSKKFHALFTDIDGKSLACSTLNTEYRGRFTIDEEENKNLSEEDAWSFHGRTCVRSKQEVLTTAFSYFANEDRVNQQKTLESGAYHRLYNQDFFSLN